jgi:hypothetical protein
MQTLKTPLLLITLFFSFAFVNCTPDKPKEEEQALTIAIDPDTGTTVAKAIGPTYGFKLVITSTMPEQGVTVDVDFKKDLDNTVVFSQSLSTSAAATDITIGNLVFNEPGTVTINVKSKTKSTNTAQKTFKLVRK